MKSLLYLLPIAALLFGQCKSAEPKVVPPEMVTTIFAGLYPGATEVTWEREDSLYEASFMQDTVNKSVTFQPDGTVVDLESAIPLSLLPPAVTDYVQQQLGGKRIKEATRIIHADGMIDYEIAVENKDYLFDSNGSLIQTKEEESGDE